MSNVKFWHHPFFGFTSIMDILQKYSDIQIYEFDKTLVNPKDVNVISFFWETDSQIGIPFIVNTQEFLDILKELNSLGFYLLADFSTEVLQGVDTLSLYNLQHSILPNFNLSKFFLVQNDSTNSNLGSIKYGNFTIRTIYIPYFILSTPSHMQNYAYDLTKYNSLEKKKDFLCLNRRIRYPKFIFLKKLWQLNLLDNTYWTWVCSYLPKDLFQTDSFLQKIGVDYSNSKSIQLEDDVMYGSNLDKADEYLYTVNPKWYFETKVNLVVETCFYAQPIHITEKTIKPIYLGVPFVVFASKTHLNKLKELGFDVFESVIGKYDCTSEKSVIKAGIRLAKLHNTNEVLEICEHNKNLIRNIGFLKKIFENTFIKSLKQLNVVNGNNLI
jgi:hypothetical protein